LRAATPVWPSVRFNTTAPTTVIYFEPGNKRCTRSHRFKIAQGFTSCSSFGATYSNCDDWFFVRWARPAALASCLFVFTPSPTSSEEQDLPPRPKEYPEGSPARGLPLLLVTHFHPHLWLTSNLQGCEFHTHKQHPPSVIQITQPQPQFPFSGEFRTTLHIVDLSTLTSAGRRVDAPQQRQL
jgi:hypothetical protein